MFHIFGSDPMSVRESRVLKLPTIIELGLICVLKSIGTLFMKLGASEFVIYVYYYVFLINCFLLQNQVSFISSDDKFSLEFILSY